MPVGPIPVSLNSSPSPQTRPLQTQNQSEEDALGRDMPGKEGAAERPVLRPRSHSPSRHAIHHQALDQFLESLTNPAQKQWVSMLAGQHPEWVISHQDELKNMTADALQAFFSLMLCYEEWTKAHFPTLKGMNEFQLQGLPSLLLRHEKWTTTHLPVLKDMKKRSQLTSLHRLIENHEVWLSKNLPRLVNMSQLIDLPRLLEIDEEWVTENIPLLAGMEGNSQLFELAHLLENHPEWTKNNFTHLKEMNQNQLREVFPLLEEDEKWTEDNLPILKEMTKEGQLRDLLPLVLNHKNWTTEHLPILKDMKKDLQLLDLLPLVTHHEKWTTKYLMALKDMDGTRQLRDLLPFVERHEAWTSDHLPELTQMNMEGHLQALLPFVDTREAWATKHLPSLMRMTADELHGLFYFLDNDSNWAEEHFPELCEHKTALPYLYACAEHSAVGIEQIQNEFLKISASGKSTDFEYMRQHFLELMDDHSGGFNSAANPFLRELLPARSESDMENVLKANGATRSMGDPSALIDSHLTREIEENHRKLEGETVGIELEAIGPGLGNILPSPESIPSHEPDSDSDSDLDSESEPEDDLQTELNRNFKTSNYVYVEDASLSTSTNLAMPFEMRTFILRNIDNFKRLQNYLSILNDMGVYMNFSCALQMHFGIKQWNTSKCLSMGKGKEAIAPKGLELEKLDLSGSRTDPTQFQLLLMKQYLINMDSIQETYYIVAKKSQYALPNRPDHVTPADFYREVSKAKDLNELMRIAQRHGREHCVNFRPFQDLGTVEARGGAMKNGDNIGADPNIALEFISLQQKMFIKSLEELSDTLLGLQPGNPIEDAVAALRLKPADGLQEIADNFVQKVLYFQSIHAMEHRGGSGKFGRRFKAMEEIKKDKHHIKPHTLERICMNEPGDQLSRDFLAFLKGELEEWNPPLDSRMVVRKRSLRAIADAAYARK